MQLVRTLALMAAVCGACVAAQDTNSPPPPAGTPMTTPPTTAATPRPGGPPDAAPAAPGAPNTATGPSLSANKTEEGTFTIVQINSQAANAEVQMLPAGGFVPTETTTIKASVGGAAPFTMDTAEQVRVLVTAETTSLQLLKLESTKLKTLEFASYEDKTTTTISLTGNGFSNLSLLSSLAFQNIRFYKDPVTLPVPETLAYLKVEKAIVSDLSLVTASDTSNLNEVAFTDTKFTALPYVLYQRLYTKVLKVNGNFSMAEDFTQLSGQEYANAMRNLGDILSFLVFTPSCDGVTGRSASDLSAAAPRHVVCNDSRRTGIRKFGQNQISLDPAETAPPSSATPRGSNSNTTLTVIVIVIAVIAAVLAYFVARRYFCTSSSLSRSPRMNERTVGLISKDESQNAHGSNGSTAANPNKLSFISSDDALRQIRLEQQDVSVTKSVGTGRLWVGDYSGRKVMIKRIEAESNDSYATKALITQARSLAPLSHPNIVSLVGVTWVQGTDFGVVGEFMDKGTLRSVLMDLDSELDLQSKLHMCLDLALALKHLHVSDMYMRRLTSRKVLVNAALECKLNLFECHPTTNKVDYPEVFGSGEMAWEAPELITRTGVLDPRKINMFSLGVLIGEIMTRVSPYQSAVDAVGHTLADLELVKRIRRQDRLMPHENRREFTELPTALREIVERCLSYQPLARPSAEEVIQCLESVKDYSERFGSTTSL